MASLPVDLRDDGAGGPDLFKYDGIYSGTFVPDIDQTYELSLLVSAPGTEVGPRRSRRSGSDLIGRLLPIDQTPPPCTNDNEEGVCSGVEPSALIQRFLPAAAVVAVTNAPTFGSSASKILDLDHEAFDQYRVVLHWTSPTLLGAVAKSMASIFLQAPLPSSKGLLTSIIPCFQYRPTKFVTREGWRTFLATLSPARSSRSVSLGHGRLGLRRGSSSSGM